MNTKKLFILTFICVLGAGTLKAQNSVGIVPIEFNRVSSNILNQSVSPQFVFGVYFDKNLWNKPWSWSNNISYATHKKYVGSNNCADCLSGDVKQKRFQVSTGMSYQFWYTQDRPWRWYVQSDIFYRNTQQSGQLSGGLDGNVILVDEYISEYGLMFRSGIDYYIKGRYVLGYQLPFEFSKGTLKNNTQNTNTKVSTMDFTNYGQLRIGYKF